MPDLESYLDPPKRLSSDPVSRVHSVAQRINVSPEIADDYLKVTGGIESGNRQFTNTGQVLTGPPTRSSSRARGMGQVMPDRPGGMTRTIRGRTYNLADPDENNEAGLLLFSAGGADPVGRRLEYFGGQKARKHYERTGRIPQGGDGYTTFDQYVKRTMSVPAPRRARDTAPSVESYLDPQQSSTVPLPGNITEMAALTAPQPEATQTPALGTQTSPPPDIAQAATPQRPITGADLAWHLGADPSEFQNWNRRTQRRALRIVTEAVTEDERKKAAGQEIAPPPLAYQNQMRQRAGMPVLDAAVNLDPTAQWRTKLTPRYPTEPKPLDREARIDAELARRNEGVQDPRRLLRREAVVPFVDQQIAQEASAEARHQADAHSRIGQITQQALDVIEHGVGDPSTGIHPSTLANVTRGVTGFVGSTLRQAGAVSDIVPPVLGIGDALKRTGHQLEAGAAEQGRRTAPAGTYGQVVRGLQESIGRATGEIPKLIAGGALLKAVGASTALNLPIQGALSRAEEGVPGVIKGAAGGFVYHYGGALTGPYLSKVGNTLLWVGAPAAEAHFVGGQPWEQAIAETLPMGAFAGAGGGERVNIRDAKRLEGYRPARLRDLRRIMADPSLVVPPVDVRIRPEEGPIQLPTGGRTVVPEKRSTIAAQIEVMVSRRGNRMAVLIPEGEPGPTKIPKGYTATRTEAGLMIHPAELRAEDVQSIVSEGDTWRLLGHPNPDTPEASRVVVARAGRDTMAHGRMVKAGSELATSYVTPGLEPAAIEEFRQQFAPYKPYVEVGGEQTAENVVNQRSEPDVIQETTPQAGRVNQAETVSARDVPRDVVQPNASGTTEPQSQRDIAEQPRTEGVSDRFAALGTRDLEIYIENAQKQGARRLARLEARPPKGTPKETRQALPRRIERQRTRMDARIAEAQTELTRRRAGNDKAPSFEQWLTEEAGGKSGGIDPATLSPIERQELQARYDEQFYPRPHHSLRQNRRQRGEGKGRFAQGIASAISGENITETITKSAEVPAPWETEAAPEQMPPEVLAEYPDFQSSVKPTPELSAQELVREGERSLLDRRLQNYSGTPTLREFAPTGLPILTKAAKGSGTFQEFEEIAGRESGAKGEARTLIQVAEQLGVSYKDIYEALRSAQPSPQVAPKPTEPQEPLVDAEGNLRDEAGNVLFAKDKIPKGWVTAEPGEKFAPQFSVEENRVKLENSEASRLLDTAYQQMGMAKRGDQGIGGVFEANAQRLVTQLEKMTEDGAPELAKAVRQASDAGEGKVLLAFGDSAMVHERFHESSGNANRYLQDRHADFDAFETDPTFQKIRTALTGRMHYPDTAHVLVEEGAAYIAAGDYQRLNITRREAIDYLSKWFESFIEHNGDVSVERFKEMAKDGQEALSTAIERRGQRVPSTSTDERVSGVQEGRKDGTAKGRAPPRETHTLDDVAALFARRPNETEDQYTKRTKGALDSLRKLAESRGQKLPEYVPRRSEQPASPATTQTASTSADVKPTDTSAASKTALPPPRRHVPGERSFPKTAERSGFTGGTDRDYSVITDKAALDEADRRIARMGLGRAQAQLASTEEPTKHDGAMGILLIQKFEKMGDIKRAVEVANDLSRKYTQAGQFVQSAAIITRLSPEGVLLAAQRQMKGGRQLSEETAKAVIDQAKAITADEALVNEIRRQHPYIFNEDGSVKPFQTARQEVRDSGTRPVTRKRARERIGKLQDRLAVMEQQARARMEARKAQAPTEPLGPEAGAGINPLQVAADLKDWAIIGAAKLARKGIDRATWLAEMAKEASAFNRKDLRRLYRESYRQYEEQRQQFLRESRERGAERAFRDAGTGEATQEPVVGPLRRQDYNRLISEHLDRMTQARKDRADLARTFRDLNAGTTTKVIRTARDVWDLSRSAITSVDISGAGRQAKMALIPHPVTFTRGLFRQFKALSTKQYERMVSENQVDPDYKLAVRFKPDFFTSTATTRGGHEEVYQSELGRRIPWIKHSEQMYNTMLDTVRLGWWKSQLKALKAEGLDPDNPAHKPLFQLQADLISNFNGRGGGKLVKHISPIANHAFFSTRFWASRLRVLTLPLDPRMYGVGTVDHPAYAKATRVDAWKTLIGFYGLTASTLAIAKMTGAEVNLTDPDDPDWLKARWGKVHVDFSSGLQSHLRVAARLGKLIYMRERYPQRQRNGPTDILGHYLRSKEAPNIALIHDLFLSDKKKTSTGPRGTNVIGEPVYLTGERGKGRVERLRTSALAQRVIPIVFQDVMDAYQEGLSKKQAVLSIGASLFGEGVTTYEPKKKRGRGQFIPAPQRQAPVSP